MLSKRPVWRLVRPARGQVAGGSHLISMLVVSRPNTLQNTICTTTGMTVVTEPLQQFSWVVNPFVPDSKGIAGPRAGVRAGIDSHDQDEVVGA